MRGDAGGSCLDQRGPGESPSLLVQTVMVRGPLTTHSLTGNKTRSPAICQTPFQRVQVGYGQHLTDGEKLYQCQILGQTWNHGRSNKGHTGHTNHPGATEI